MTNYEKKEERTLDDIAKIMTKLDNYINDIQENSDTPSKEREIKKWFAQKKAFHEVKRLLHDVDKYEKFQENELDGIVNNFNNLGLDEETVVFLTNYF